MAYEISKRARPLVASATLTIWALAISALALAGLAASGCAKGLDEGFGGGSSTSTSSTGIGGAGGTSSGGGEAGSGNTSACAVDCSQIQTPACQVAQCNTQTGQCEVVADVDNTSCDDGLFCTAADACLAGVCEPGSQNDCGVIPDACDDVTCNETSQTCSTVPKQNGAPCTDPNDLCLTNTTCMNGLCTGTEKDCFFSPVPDDCHVSECNPQNGLCEPVIGNEGDPCTDAGDLCTVGKTCATGVCQGGNPKDCSQLTVGCNNGVCNVNTGQCEQQPVAPGQQCAEATDQCNQGICDNQSNCNPQPANEGQTCNDNSFCSSNDTCQSGVCTGATMITTCINGDFCCPPNCTLQTDTDCNPIPHTFNAVNRGWWKADGAHTSGNNNTLTGQSSSLYNSYFSFVLTGVTGTVISAELVLEIESYTSPDASETISVWDVSTPAATLEATGTSVPIYTDLMTGNTYGTSIVLSSEVGSLKTIPLSAQAVTDINAAMGGDFSVGCSNSTVVSTGSEWVRFSASSEARTHQLIIYTL
jgi:hypothetical protein